MTIVTLYGLQQELFNGLVLFTTPKSVSLIVAFMVCFTGYAKSTYKYR